MRGKLDFDGLLRDLVLVGFGGLIGWVIVAGAGSLSGLLQVAPQPTLKFLLAVLILSFARRTYWELREWRWRHTPPEERYGFASPLWETPRAGDDPGALPAEPPSLRR
jgi:hypothetical protein